jgi:hypothetical protein
VQRARMTPLRYAMKLGLARHWDPLAQDTKTKDFAGNPARIGISKLQILRGAASEVGVCQNAMFSIALN